MRQWEFPIAAAQQAVMDLAPITERVVNLGQYQAVSKAFADAKSWVVGAAVLAGIALTVFGAAGKPSSADDAAKTPAAVVPAAPAQVSVILNSDTDKQLRAQLKCQTTPLQALAVGGDPAALDVIITSPECRPVQFTLTPERGVAVSRDSPVTTKP